jgi:hypothetical protein
MANDTVVPALGRSDVRLTPVGFIGSLPCTGSRYDPMTKVFRGVIERTLRSASKASSE